MNNEWIHPNTIIGDAATGERYYKRQYINDGFWREVAKGNHILFVAPRRVGKTSIMKDLEANPPDGYVCIYHDIEGVDSKDEFFHCLLQLILQCVNRIEKTKTFFKGMLQKYSNISDISTSGIKFSNTGINYEKALTDLISDLKEQNIHTVIFLDEFAEVINRLIKKGLKDDAIQILHSVRAIRHDENFKHFTLVFAGSIGLHSVVKTLDRPKLINDLYSISTNELTEKEAIEFIYQLVNEATIRLSSESINYFIVKIKHLLPYYIQLMVDEIDSIAHKSNIVAINADYIDIAFDNILKNNKNFQDWLSRLKDYQPQFFPFINEILKHCAHKNSITLQEVYDKAINDKFNRSDDYMDFINQLLEEGYLAEFQKDIYQFISPFLQQFWLKQFPIYDGR